MIEVTDSTFQTEVKDYKGTVLVDFYAVWCGPCKMLSPMLDKMSEENKDPNVKFVKINVDEAQSVAGSFGIMSIPTVIVFKDGVPAVQQVGVATPAVYEQMIAEANK